MKKILFPTAIALIVVACLLFLFQRRSATPTPTTENASPVEQATEQPAPAPAAPVEYVPTLDPSREPIETFSVPILMYHYIRDYTDRTDQTGVSLSVSPKNFEVQMQWLSDHGFQTVDPTYVRAPYKMDKKPIILTFDDGYQDNYDAAVPILKKFGFTGTFYVVSSFIGTPGYMTWDELREMRDAGMDIGSHTVSHVALTLGSREAREEQILGSKREIEKNLGSPVHNFCYPFGKYNQVDADLAKAAGYATTVDTKSGVNTEASDPFKLKRLTIRNWSVFQKIPQLNLRPARVAAPADAMETKQSAPSKTPTMQ